MKIAIFSTNVEGIYSGGRYLSLIMGYSLSRAGAHVSYFTNLVPAFNGDFEALHGATPLNIVLEDNWPDGDPDVDWVIVIPTGSLNDSFYEKARAFAVNSSAQIALLSFETANWFNALSKPQRSPLPWESWAQVISDGGLILTIAKEGIPYAKDFYSNLVSNAQVEYDFWYPAINDFAVQSIDWPKIPKYPNRIASFVRTSDPHKGASAFLQLPPKFFEGKSLSLIFGRGIEKNFLRDLYLHTKGAHGFSIAAYDRVSDEEKLAILAASSVLFFPSGFEGFGYPPIEAAAVGTPTVSYDLPVVRETLGSSGHFVARGDIFGLATKLSEVATAENAERVPLSAPGLYGTLEAGQQLLAKLDQAARKLPPAKLQKPKKSHPGPAEWLTAGDVRFDCSAEYEHPGVIRVHGVISATHLDGKMDLAIAGMKSAQFEIFETPRPGLLKFACAIPETFSTIAEGALTIAAFISGNKIGESAIPITLDPTQRLSRHLVDVVEHTDDRYVLIRIDSEEFGKSLAARLALSSLVIELSSHGLHPSLCAAKRTIDRLARAPELMGLFYGVALNNPLTVQPSQIMDINIHEGANKSGCIADCQIAELTDRKVVVDVTISPDTGLPLREDAGAMSALQMVLGKGFLKRSILLSNALKSDGLNAAAFELIQEIRRRVGSATAPIFYCIKSSQGFEDNASWRELPQYVYLIEPEQVAISHDYEQSILVDCSLSPDRFTKDHIRLSAQSGDLIIDTPESVCRTADQIIERLEQTLKATRGMFDEFVRTVRMPNGSSLYKQVVALNDAHDKAVQFTLSEPRDSISPSAIPSASASDIATTESKRCQINSFLRGCSYRTYTGFTEVKTDTAISFEFALNEVGDAIIFDAVAMRKSSDTKKLEVEIVLNGRPCGSLTIAPNRFERMRVPIDVVELDKNSSAQLLQLIPKTSTPGDTLRFRAVSIYSVCRSEEATILPATSSGWQAIPIKPVANDVANHDMHSFSLALKSAQSVVLCGRGWGSREKNYRWTVGRCAEVLVPFTLGTTCDLKLNILAGAFVGTWAKQSTMTIQINGVRIGDLAFTNKPEKQSILIPREIAATGFDRIDLVVSNPVSPAAKGLSGDKRELGFCVYEIGIEALSSSTSRDASSEDFDAFAEKA